MRHNAHPTGTAAVSRVCTEVWGPKSAASPPCANCPTAASETFRLLVDLAHRRRRRVDRANARRRLGVLAGINGWRGRPPRARRPRDQAPARRRDRRRGLRTLAPYSCAAAAGPPETPHLVAPGVDGRLGGRRLDRPRPGLAGPTAARRRAVAAARGAALANEDAGATRIGGADASPKAIAAPERRGVGGVLARKAFAAGDALKCVARSRRAAREPRSAAAADLGPRVA